MKPGRAIPVIRGRQPEVWEGEYKEFDLYESGRADAIAKDVAGAEATADSWLEIVRQFEPAAKPATDRLLADPELAARIHGSVLDVGAGSCVLTAELSKRRDVSQVFAVDLSERFLTTTGASVLAHCEAMTDKVTFVATDFNHLPLKAGSIDAAFIFAAIHHSLSPIKTIQEVARVVKPGGTIFILENPHSVMGIRRSRQRMLDLSSQNTEIAYTRAELEYLIANANVGALDVRRWDVLSRPGPRRWVRHVLRWCGLEDVLLNPPNYLFIITRR